MPWVRVRKDGSPFRLLQPESVCVTLENPEAARHLGT